jgi:hypothetical protein
VYRDSSPFRPLGRLGLETGRESLVQKPFSDAPPASASAATALKAAKSRMRRSFIGRSSAFLSLPALVGLFRCHARTSSRPPCPKNMETDLTRKSVGCTTHSTLTLSAQFRWGHQRVRAFMDTPYISTSARRTICTSDRTGQYATLPMHTGPSGPSWSPLDQGGRVRDLRERGHRRPSRPAGRRRSARIVPLPPRAARLLCRHVAAPVRSHPPEDRWSAGRVRWR